MSDTAAETSFDNALDERQRNMLEAMGIKLWQTPVSAAPETVLPAAVTAAAKSANFEDKQAPALIKQAQDATKSVAKIAFSSIITSSLTPAEPAEPANSQTSALAPRPAGIEQMRWPDLQSAVASCEACNLCQSRKKTVFGIGQAGDAAQAPQVDWLVVGEAPGENEDAQGEPFVGQAGKLLDNMLAAMTLIQKDDGTKSGLSRTQGTYITNVLKCRPPANRNPSPTEVAMCEPYLARQIELLRPRIIVAMGKFAISSLTGSTEPVGKLRGRVHALKHASYQTPVIVTYHPAYLLRNLPDKAKAWADLLLAMKTYLELPRSDA